MIAFLSWNWCEIGFVVLQVPTRGDGGAGGGGVPDKLKPDFWTVWILFEILGPCGLQLSEARIDNLDNSDTKLCCCCCLVKLGLPEFCIWTFCSLTSLILHPPQGSYNFTAVSRVFFKNFNTKKGAFFSLWTQVDGYLELNI